tara:strand:- start:1829 stop:2437 length:609 start_codon:yes stop_codon:yes gene_type:complete
MFRKIKLYGKLAEYTGHKEFEVNSNAVKTPLQAVRFLTSNFKGVEQHISQNNYQVKIGDNFITETELNFPLGLSNIHIIPVIEGSGGVGRIIGGIALIGLGIASGGVGFSLFTKAGWAGAVFKTKALIYGGGLLALSGASQLLAPQPQTPDFQSSQDPRISFNFSGIQNVTRAGTPIPICYGEIFVGSVVISAQVDTEQVQG